MPTKITLKPNQRRGSQNPFLQNATLNERHESRTPDAGSHIIYIIYVFIQVIILQKTTVNIEDASALRQMKIIYNPRIEHIRDETVGPHKGLQAAAIF
jgi:hypothetical protein